MTETTKYGRVKELLRERIREEYGVGSKIPSTTALHRTLGLSPGTINRAIQDLVDEGLLVRHKSRGTFVAEQRPKSKSIGFLWRSVQEQSTSTTPYTAAILHGAEEEAERLHHNILIGGTGRSSRPKFTERPDRAVAGVIVLFNSDPRLVEAYHNQGTPVVLVDPFVAMAGIPYVTSGHFSAAREATLHLARLGHRRIVHATIEFPVSCMQIGERTMGYQEAMREAGLSEYAHVHVTPLEDERLQARRRPFVSLAEALAPGAGPALRTMLEEVCPTAMVCFDDGIASWVLTVCRDAGVRVPEDLSLVGINDDGLAAHLWPPLTTVHLPLDDVGRAAVRKLDVLMNEGRLTGSGKILPVRLMERASVRPLGNGDGSNGRGDGKRD